jgi:hypothetical protein
MRRSITQFTLEDPMRKTLVVLASLALWLMLGGTALAQGPQPQTSDPFWIGQYWNNMTLANNPVLQRNDTTINFDWGLSSPDPAVNPDQFSARWQRYIETGAGAFKFTATSDDGIRVWVDGDLIIDQWTDHPPTTFNATKNLSAGHHLVKVEYYENGYGAVARLTWTSVAVAGTVIVDDTSAGFVRGGIATSWRSVTSSEGWGGHLFWTWNNDVVRTGFNYGRWYPALVAGARYEVFAHIPNLFSTTGKARYWVAHADGFTLHPVNQNLPGPYWASLGTYRFTGTSSDYVSLSDVTYETRLSRMVAFDAMKFEPR